MKLHLIEVFDYVNSDGTLHGARKEYINLDNIVRIYSEDKAFGDHVSAPNCGLRFVEKGRKSLTVIEMTDGNRRLVDKFPAGEVVDMLSLKAEIPSYTL